MSETVVRGLPIWRSEVSIEPLSGGLTNLNYRVQDGDRTFAVRTSRDDPLLGISRSNELACATAAAELGIAPRIVHSAPGVMVTEFVAGTPLTPALAAERIAQVAGLARRIHGAQVTGHLQYFSPFQVARTYVRAARDHGWPLPSGVDSDALVSEVATLEARLLPFRPTFCHNDMMPGNFLDTGERLWIIDWEYAGIGHPLFDVAGISSNCEFDHERDRALLTAYLGGDDETAFGQFRLLKAMAALRESLWAVVQGTQSGIDFDYGAYRDDNYRKYRTCREALA